MVETMKWEDGNLILLDQTKLPVSVEWISCDTYQRVGKAIQKLEVRGAPAIGAAAAFAMVLAWRKIVEKYETKRDVANTSNMQLQTYAAMLYGSHDHAAKKLQQQLLKKFLQARNDLDASRPTAVNLSWATKLMYDAACKMSEAGLDLPQTDAELEKLAVKVYEQDIAKNRKMGEYGAEVVPEEAVILTHCNAGALATCGWGTALGVIRSAHEQGKVKMVYSDETRPLLQGSRLTAWELLEDNIPVTTITDNMAAWSMKTKGINIVITGADRIAANGDTANKIGTYGVALAAKAHGIPFYIAAPASTFDFSLKNGTQIPIEERNANEVRSFQGKVSAPKNVNVFNPAFDVTPAKLIAGIITEYGVLRPPFSKSIKELKTKVLREELFTWKA
ncbi:MAG: S-methyl-5-thioribose-1-phosphate isomerase [Acidaminococcaceae bacterium]|nr:S-methyl-5-thioribose-1-phosphate isomerase [Acidaminococcaceae bacterium]